MRHIEIVVDVGPVDFLALIEPEVLDSEQLYACNVTNRLIYSRILSEPGEPLK